jgi:hypothetical protein
MKISENAMKLILYLMMFVAMLVISLLVIMNEAAHQKEYNKLIYSDAFATANYCYTSSMQCGLHNAFEEGDYEDHNIHQMILWIEENENDLSEYDVECGLKVANFLLGITYEKRQEFIDQLHEVHLWENQ